MARLCIFLGLWLALCCGPINAQEVRFEHSGVASDAKRYETYLRANWPPRDARAEGGRLLQAGDARAAAKSFAEAVVLDANDAEAWNGLARALLAITPDQGSERYDLPVNASGAAWLAYQRGQTASAKAAALVVLHDALERRSYWRPAIEALRASLSLVDDAGVREAYDKLVAERGFRILEYKVEADSIQPRLCIQFSERLAPGTADWAEYFKVDGKDPQAVTADAQQICLDGLAHGKHYEVRVRAGLPSAVGEKLQKTAELAIYVRDRAPSVRAAGRGYLLPNRGQEGIPLLTVNTETIKVEVLRIGDRSLAQALQSGDFQKQISAYDLEAIRERTGARVFTGEMRVTSRLNEDVTTAFPIAEAVPRLEPGVYVLAAFASPSGEQQGYRNAATQWFITSDLGLTAISGEDGLHAFVRSLTTATAVVNANLRLIARNNEVLGTAKTDSRGYAHFAAGQTRGEGGLAPAVLAADTAEGDYAFLDLATAAFDLTDRGVKGRPAPGPIDAFAFTERGVYRPGEEVHLTALARDGSGRASSVPLTIVFVRPDGVEHARSVLPDQGLGGRTMTVALAGSAMTGTWRVKVYSDPKAQPIAQAAFLVEDFVPERLELKLEPAVAALGLEEVGTIKLTGRYLYGPPAAGLAVEGEIAVKLAKGDVEGFAGYRFGPADETFAPIRKPLEQLPTTDAEGKADIGVRLPALPKTGRPLEADVILKLRESGGRTIERTLTLPVDMHAPRIGLKPLFAGNQVQEGTTATFQAILLGSDGKPMVANGLKWQLVRLDQRWQWYSRDGTWSFEPVTTARRIAAGAVDAEHGEVARIEARVDWGRYRLEVSAADGSGAASSVVFNAGFWADEAADSPEMLEVALDKASYRVGETARVRIASRSGGRALIAILASRLVRTEEVDLPPGGGDVPLRVGSDWNPGAYVTVMLYRPLDAGAKRMPSRALGLRWLAIDQAPRTLRVDLDAPDKVRSGSQLTVPVRIAGLAAGEDSRLTLAAVDVGILNVTRFEAPKPESWFFGQRRIGSEIRDVYGRLIDGMRAERGRLRSGGDGSGEGMSIEGTPPVEETLALFSGIVKAGPDGGAKVELRLPDFNGTVRLSAVAWSADKLGSASKDVIVRDAVALTASAPRFLTLGDDARLELALHNVEGPAGAYTISGEYASDAAQAAPGFQRTVTLGAGERRREAFHLQPGETGLTKLSLTVTGPDGIEVRRRLTFDVKVPAGDIKRVTVASLAASGGKITLSEDLLHDLIAKTARVTLSVGPAAYFDVPGLIVSLDRYPHGCAEQTTSRALPLLYVNEVAERIGLAGNNELRERVQKAIDRVLEMQDASGAFGTWGPQDGDMWLTSYVTDFLTRAKELGYVVRAAPFNQALERLENYLSYVQDFESGGEERAYALYVLARNGRAPMGELRYYVDAQLDRFATPLARAQLGAALAMLGDRQRAERAMTAAFKAVTERDEGLARRDYGTGLRDGAALITLASEAGIDRDSVPRLVDVVAKAFQVKAYTSTQEQAWLLLAAHALGDAATGTALTIDGRPHSGPLQRTLAAAELQRGVTIANTGDAAVEAVVSVIGAALTPEPAVSKGITLERSYYTLDGRRVNLQSATGGSDELKQNDRLVVVLKVEASAPGGRLVLVDRLPAGLEIENPRLVDAGDIKTLDWLKTTRKPEHTEFRDDRFVAAFDFFASRSAGRRVWGDGEAQDAVSSASVAYLVRAVTPGSFVHPAASVEDMYRPDRFARTASGHLIVR
jgi:alpha-2-macroglobulin